MSDPKPGVFRITLTPDEDAALRRLAAENRCTDAEYLNWLIKRGLKG